LPEAYIELNMADANCANVGSGDRVALRVNGHDWELAARVSDRPPQGAALLPRSIGGPPLARITPVVLRKVES
jgi:predicted molibdopterin-dependent oxidoreductase YjgC